MAIYFDRTLTGNYVVAPPKDNAHFHMTNATAGVAGTVYKSTAGKLILAATTDTTAMVIAIESVAAATPGAAIRGFYILPGMVFKTKPTGAQHANFLTGITTAPLDAAGATLNWASDPTAGACTVIDIDANGWVYFVFNKCALAL